jgi:hypothetical protein
VDVGGQEVSRSRSDDAGIHGIDDWLWLDKLSGDVMGFDEVLVIRMVRRGVVLTWHEQNGKSKMQTVMNYSPSPAK